MKEIIILNTYCEDKQNFVWLYDRVKREVVRVPYHCLCSQSHVIVPKQALKELKTNSLKE